MAMLNNKSCKPFIYNITQFYAFMNATNGFLEISLSFVISPQGEWV